MLLNAEGLARRKNAFYADPRNGAVVKDTILSSGLWSDIRPVLTEDAAASIEALGRNDTWWTPPPGIKSHAFLKLCWLIFAQAIADEIEW